MPGLCDDAPSRESEPGSADFIVLTACNESGGATAPFGAK